MTDAGFSFFQFATAVVLTFFNAGCLSALYFPFLPGHTVYTQARQSTALSSPAHNKHTSGRLAACPVHQCASGGLSACGLVYLLYSAASFLCLFLPIPGILGMLGLIVCLGLFAPAFRLNHCFSLFLAFLYFSFEHAIRLAGNSLLYILNTRFAYGRPLETALRNTAYNYAIVYGIESITLFLLAVLLGRRIIKTRLELAFREWGYLCIVPLIGITSGEIVERLLFVVKDHVAFSIYAAYPACLLLLPLLAFLCCASMIGTLISQQDLAKLHAEQNGFLAERRAAQMMRERIDALERFFDGSRKLRHEMRNHLTNIQGLARSGNYAEISQYIARMGESMDAFPCSERTGNPVLDLIVSGKKSRAENNGIAFQLDFSFPASEGFDAYDIGIIVNNLLENAIEACERMQGNGKYISLSGRRKKKFFLIEVANSYEREIVFQHGKGLPLSTKENPAGLHGIGLSNVQEIAQKYMGGMDIQAGQNEFRVTVLLQERKEL